jgi:Zn-dependent protease
MDNGEYFLPGAGLPSRAPEPAPESPFAQRQGSSPFARARKRLGGILAALVALLAKFWAVVKGAVLLLPKFKLLTTAGTALVSVAAYSLWFGWTFAVGFVILLFVHEMGHVIQLRREGIKATAPMFIPFMGAFISAKSLGENAYSEAKVGLAGPILGTAGAAVCLAIAEITNSDLLRALAYFGFFLNLFNLIPLVPFDGGRAMAAMAPAMWFVGLGAMVAAYLVTHNPFILLFAVIGGFTTYHRWKQRKSGSLEQAAYYRISRRSRLVIGLVYVALIVVLVLGMDASHILSTGTHSFRSL